MTRDVVTVTPDTSLKDVAELLVERGISGVPVCDADGQVVGVVTERDILWKEVGAPMREEHVWTRWLERAYGVNERIAAMTAGQAMTAPAVTVGPDAPVNKAAELMIGLRINRLPVVDGEGRLVGIVTRADLVRAFTRTDEEIAREIADDVLLRKLWLDPATVSVRVDDGVVTITGHVENRSTADVVEEYIRRVPGVSALRSDLRWPVEA